MTRKTLILIMAVVAAASAVAYFVTGARGRGFVLTGIVTTNQVLVSSEVSGRIIQLRVQEGDPVSQGELLAVINPQPYRADQNYYVHNEQSFVAQVQQAEAALRYQELQTRNQVKQAKASLASARAQQAQAAADLQNDALNNKRTQALFEQGVMSAQANDQAQATYKAARAQWESLGKQVEVQRAALALAESNEQQNLMRESQLEASRRQRAASAAQVQKAGVMLQETQIHAPVSGVIDVRASLPGEVVNPGEAIVTIINPDDLWVRVDVPETIIDRIRLGDRFQVRFPSGMEKPGTVFSVVLMRAMPPSAT